MKKALTLAEILIAVLIIGIVVTLTLPSFFINAQQREFMSQFKKAINTINNAIDLSYGIEGDSPYELKKYNPDCNRDGVIDAQDSLCFKNKEDPEKGVPKLAELLMRHIKVVKTAILYEGDELDDGPANFAFYTIDGIRFEMPIQIGDEVGEHLLPLHENPDIKIGTNGYGIGDYTNGASGSMNTNASCGAYGLNINPERLKTPPCMLVVDVNGDNKPNPSRITKRRLNSHDYAHEKYKVPKPTDKRIGDVFVFMIADRTVIPYGVLAQKVMYEMKKKK